MRMDPFGCCEIVELRDDTDVWRESSVKVKPESSNDVERLIYSAKILSKAFLPGQAGIDLSKSAQKKPETASSFQVSKSEIYETLSLKQALRKMCISQASEMAATKRLLKSSGTSGVVEDGTLKKLYAAVVIKDCRVQGEGTRKEGEKVVLPSKATESSSGSSSQMGSNNKGTDALHSVPQTSVKRSRIRIQDVLSSKSKMSKSRSGSFDMESKGKAISKSSTTNSPRIGDSNKSMISLHLAKPVVRGKTFIKKVKPEPLTKLHESNNSISPVEVSPIPQREPQTPQTCGKKLTNSANLSQADDAANKSASTPKVRKSSSVDHGKASEISRSKEKGESSHSSKSSIGDFSSSTSISDDSNGSFGSKATRPHMSKDLRWTAICRALVQQGPLGLKNFKLLKKLGCGDIGTVYLAELIGSECLFAIKVMDIEFLLSRKKILRAQTEREILQILDHPFLPSLFSHFTTDNLCCLVMDYCPGGDLHVLRQNQPTRTFSEPAARFYVAEILVALEYLHMFGVIYRDLKPENILVREDGHIMLSDFDLSLRCSVSPVLLRCSSFGREPPRQSGPCRGNSCIDPFCPQPSCVRVSCFAPRSVAVKAQKGKSNTHNHVCRFPELVVEPTDARSDSFVGTHEYLAPEIIRGDGHGSSVDWWTLGIFLYELLFGRTPFKGSSNEETLANAVSQSLDIPDSPVVSVQAKDLIKGLLAKEPENRLGSVKGAAEIKNHPFFHGLNWALIRSTPPPEMPRSCETAMPSKTSKKKEGKCLEFMMSGSDIEFELF